MTVRGDRTVCPEHGDVATIKGRCVHCFVASKGGTDSREHVWSRVYAAVFEQAINGHIQELGTIFKTVDARGVASDVARDAVRDFDAFFGGKR